MYSVEMYQRIRRAHHGEGMSMSEADTHRPTLVERRS